MSKNISNIIHTFGFLRLALLTLVLLDMLMRPVPGMTPDYEGFHVLTNLLAPVLSPILFMLLLLDAIMTGVYLSSVPVERKPAYRVILLTDLVVAICFIAYWVPYFKAINS